MEWIIGYWVLGIRDWRSPDGRWRREGCSRLILSERWGLTKTRFRYFAPNESVCVNKRLNKEVTEKRMGGEGFPTHPFFGVSQLI